MDVTCTPRRAITCAFVVLMCVRVSAANAQAANISHSSGFFLGIGLESVGITTDQPTGERVSESGAGAGLTVGYGFSPRWSMYVHGSSAKMDAANGSTYSLGHFDVGARVHFRTGPNAIVPFIQFGLSGRGEAQTITDATGTYDVAASGGGVALGAGINAHFNPRFAATAALAISGGSFTSYTVRGQEQNFSAVDATSTRLHLGLTWFPGGK
jgi:hypothetical protein